MPGVIHRCDHVFCKTLWSGSSLTDGRETLLTLGVKRTGPSIHLDRQVQKAAEEVRHRWGSSPRWCGRCPSGTWARAGPGCPITREPSSSRRSVIKAGATALMKTRRGWVLTICNDIKPCPQKTKVQQLLPETGCGMWNGAVYTETRCVPFARRCFGGWLRCLFPPSPLSGTSRPHGKKTRKLQHTPFTLRLGKWKSLSPVWLFVTPWAIEFMGFSRPEDWSGWPFPSPGDPPSPGIKSRVSCIAGRFFTSWATREASLQVGGGGSQCTCGKTQKLSSSWVTLGRAAMKLCSCLGPGALVSRDVREAGVLKSLKHS